MPFYIYILECADKSYYTGHTDNLEKRLFEHHTGYYPGCYTFKRRPLTLKYHASFTTREEALEMELRIKGWSRKKKEALFKEDWDEIARLGKKQFEVV